MAWRDPRVTRMPGHPRLALLRARCSGTRVNSSSHSRPARTNPSQTSRTDVLSSRVSAPSQRSCDVRAVCFPQLIRSNDAAPSPSCTDVRLPSFGSSSRLVIATASPPCRCSSVTRPPRKNGCSRPPGDLGAAGARAVKAPYWPLTIKRPVHHRGAARGQWLEEAIRAHQPRYGAWDDAVQVAMVQSRHGDLTVRTAISHLTCAGCRSTASMRRPLAMRIVHALLYAV
jgi:hypothetical protein